jgi:hypothetical protein
MLKRILFRSTLTFILVFPVKAFGQEVDLAFTSGYATYNLKQIKVQRDEMLSQYPVKMRVVDDFPGYYTYGGTLRYLLVKTPLGISFRTGSTGGRSAYSDYSGSSQLDQTIRYKSIGIEGGTIVYRDNLFDVQGLLRYWYNFTDLNFITNIEIFNGSKQNEKVAFKSKSSSVSLALMVAYKFKIFKISLDAGYEFYDPSKIILSSDRSLRLVNKSNETVKFDGSGFRINGGFAIRLSKDKF